MTTPDADSRALLDGAGAELYAAVVAAGGIAEDDPRIVPGGSHRAAFDLLVSLGLLHHDDEGETWRAQDPNSVQSRVVSPLSVEGARLLDESSQWARSYSNLAHLWRKAPAEDAGPFVYLRGPAIWPHIAGLLAEAETELLTAQPQTGRETGTGFQETLKVERALLSRGVRVLTLYQHSARRSVATREYVAATTKLGAEVRTLDEFFNRMIVVDRRVAIIPSPDDLSVALAVAQTTVVAYLVDIFQRSWEKAKPFRGGNSSELKQIADEQRSMTLRMLIEGHSDPAAAKRLGVSPRTYAGYVADLKDEFEAETRFQLGYELGRQGISGDEEPEG